MNQVAQIPKDLSDRIEQALAKKPAGLLQRAEKYERVEERIIERPHEIISEKIKTTVQIYQFD